MGGRPKALPQAYAKGRWNMLLPYTTGYRLNGVVISFAQSPRNAPPLEYGGSVTRTDTHPFERMDVERVTVDAPRGLAANDLFEGAFHAGVYGVTSAVSRTVLASAVGA